MFERSPGQLFVIDGDLGALKCDAILVPVDRWLIVTDLWTELLGLERAGPLEWHRRFPDGDRVMLYEGTQPVNGPVIWLGHIGLPDASDEWYAEGLVRFVEQIASESTGPPRALPPRIAVNVAGSGRGGSSHDKGRLFRTIVPALHDAACEHDVDVVLVCWGDRQYAAAQRARQDLTSAASVRTRPPQPSKLTELASTARDGDLVLFVGAGVSMGAGLSSWSGLIGSLLVEAVAEDLDTARFWELDVRDQAAIVAGRFETEDAYQDALQRLLRDADRCSLAHGLLSSLGAREHITTNYDTLLDRALETADRTCAVMPYQPVTTQHRWLLKLHGSIDEPDDIVLTRSDYLGLPERSVALFGVLQAMLMTRHMLFVGYSLTDDSFHRVMHEIRRAQRGVLKKVGTALLLFRDPLLEELWGDILDFVAIIEDSDVDGDPVPIEIAAREHDIYLDRLCAESADVSSFLLDQTYESMLTDEERTLAEILRIATVTARAGWSPISSTVLRMLGELGA